MYLYKDEPNAKARYHCATFGSCEATHAYDDGNQAFICEKADEEQHLRRCGLGYELAYEDRYCDADDKWAELSDEWGNIPISEMQCRIRCDKNPECNYFI